MNIRTDGASVPTFSGIFDEEKRGWKTPPIVIDSFLGLQKSRRFQFWCV